jgi:hypothetical protein
MGDAQILQCFDEFLGIVGIHHVGLEVVAYELLECPVCVIGGLAFQGIALKESSGTVRDNEGITVAIETLIFRSVRHNMVRGELFSEYLGAISQVLGASVRFLLHLGTIASLTPRVLWHMCHEVRD